MARYIKHLLAPVDFQFRTLHCNQWTKIVDVPKNESIHIKYVLGPVTKLSTAPTVISSQGKEEIKHRQVCLTLGWSSVVFALCLLIEKKTPIAYSYPKVTYSYPKVI